MIDAHQLRQIRELLRRFLTPGATAVAVAVTAAAVAHVVAFARKEHDANFGVLASTSWDTRWWVTAKSTTGFTLNFSTAAPANAKVDYAVIRS